MNLADLLVPRQQYTTMSTKAHFACIVAHVALVDLRPLCGLRYTKKVWMTKYEIVWITIPGEQIPSDYLILAAPAPASVHTACSHLVDRVLVLLAIVVLIDCGARGMLCVQPVEEDSKSISAA